MKRFGRGLLTATTVAMLGAVLSSPAVADDDGDFYQPPTPYSVDYEYDAECTGADVTVSGHARGVDSLRNVPGSGGQAFLLKDRYRFEETWTDNRTGATLDVEGRGIFEELSAELVPNAAVPADVVPPEGLTGPVYLFTYANRGRLVVEDSEGRVLAVDRGLAVFRGLFDTLGDSKPGATLLRDEIVRVEGPHPILLGEVDLCELITSQPPTDDDSDEDDD